MNDQNTMIALIYRTGDAGPDTYRRFRLDQSPALQRFLESFGPHWKYIGYVLSPRAETCRPGRPQGDEDAGPFVCEKPPIGNWLQEMLETPAAPTTPLALLPCGHQGKAGEALCFICGHY